MGVFGNRSPFELVFEHTVRGPRKPLKGKLLLGNSEHINFCSTFQMFVLGFLELVNYLIRTNFREALISRFSRFVKNREIKDSLKLGYAKIKHAKFNTLL